MTKLFENKQRKRIRLVMCFIYLFQIFLCTAPFILLPMGEAHKFKDESVFSMIFKVFNNFGNIDSVGGITTFLPYFFLVLIPTAGFFVCALDKERNIKNIASLVMNFFAIMAILMVVPTGALQIGSVLQMLLYIVLTFLATAGMLTRLNKTQDVPETPAKKKIPKEEREY